MKNEIFISVILPVYNAEAYVGETIESILSQTHKNFEFIIVDDGSSDTSLSVIKSYMKTDKRIILIARENKGVVYSLNEMLGLARGKYIAKIDHDDIALPKRLEQQIKEMETKKLDICGGHYFSMSESGSILNAHLSPITHEMCVLSLVSKVPFAHPTVMMRNSFVKTHNLLYGSGPSVIAEDLDLWNTFYKNGAVFGNVDDFVLKYRILENSISRKGKKTILDETKIVLQSFLKNNLNQIKILLDNHPANLNHEEEAILLRAFVKVFKITKDIRYLRGLKKINKKILVCTIFSAFWH